MVLLFPSSVYEFPLTLLLIRGRTDSLLNGRARPATTTAGNGLNSKNFFKKKKKRRCMVQPGLAQITRPRPHESWRGLAWTPWTAWARLDHLGSGCLLTVHWDCPHTVLKFHGNFQTIIEDSDNMSYLISCLEDSFCLSHNYFCVCQLRLSYLAH